MLTDEIYFEIIKKKILESTGLDCDSYKDDFLERRIKLRLAAHGINSYKEYLPILQDDSKEYISLMDTISVDVSRFFRDRDVFDTLKNKILPEIIDKKKNMKHKVITVWSAGCDTGEEPYSIAILLNELLGIEINNYFIQIYATDISTERITRAKNALYSATKFQDMDPSYVNKYFQYSEGLFKLKEHIKKLVRFEIQDLISNSGYQFLDLIICRNVLIYLLQEVQEKILINFYKNLNEGGYLMLGKSETLIGKSRDYFMYLKEADRIYKKTNLIQATTGASPHILH